MTPRILVLSASVGAGHLRAAEAVALAFGELLPGTAVTNRDVLELTNPAFRRLYGRAYLDIVDRAPALLGYLYDLLDRPCRSGRNRGDRLRLALEKLNLAPLVDSLRAAKPDLIVNTHCLPAEIVASPRRRRRLAVKQVTVTTDFEAHRLWVNEPCERYFAATGPAAAGLVSWGVDRERIAVTGIPIHPRFAAPLERNACRRALGLDDGRPVVLQLSGGFGVGPIESLARALLAVALPLALVVVAGRNPAAARRLAAIECPSRHRLTVLGFTDCMAELMTATDLVVSKPGGLTSSEALARGAAMMIVNPIPGRESRNSDYLLEHGAAVKASSLALLTAKLEALLADPARLAFLRASALGLGRPQAAYDVARQARDQANHGVRLVSVSTAKRRKPS